MLGLKEVGAKWALYCEKLKDGSAWQPQTFDLAANAESVCVCWDDPRDDTGAGRKQNRDKERIIQLLKETGEPLTDKEISDTVAVGRAQVNKLLARLVEDRIITRDKRDPDQKKIKLKSVCVHAEFIRLTSPFSPTFLSLT